MLSSDFDTENLEPNTLLSIGKLSQATGIGPDTLRVWERRYGQPRPIRLPSGHRRYRGAEVRRLRLVSEALALGFRPKRLLTQNEDQLELLVRQSQPFPQPSEELVEWLELVRTMRAEALSRTILDAGRRLPVCAFLESCLGPMLQEVGMMWAKGEVQVRHEHFASEVVEEALRVLRRERAERRESAYQGRVLMATLPDDLHGIGMHMIALVCERRDLEPVILGVNTPLDDIAAAAIARGVDAVAVSVSLSRGGAMAHRLLSELREKLPPEIALLAGGSGSMRGRRRTRGVKYLKDCRALDGWCEKFVLDRRKSSSV